MSDLADKLPEPEEKGETLNSIMKSLGATTKENSESGSSNGGNNSDNSALVSLGNNSFGFNFDSEEGMSNNSKEAQNDSDDGNVSREKVPAAAVSSKVGSNQGTTSATEPSTSDSSNTKNLDSKVSSLSAASDSQNLEQNDAAENAVASLESIVRSFPQESLAPPTAPASTADNERKRKEPPNVAVDSKPPPSEQTSDSSAKRGRRNKKPLNDMKREERNQREKERSFRISKQITELRNLLATGGIMVPKGTKSSVLTEAANYIRMLQQHQYKSEM